MSRKTETNLILECNLTDKEKLSYSKELGDSLSKKSNAEYSLKSFQSQAKAEIARLDAEINSLADKINTGREFREVTCDILYDFSIGVKTYVRRDTEDVVKKEEILPHERQEDLI